MAAAPGWRVGAKAREGGPERGGPRTGPHQAKAWEDRDLGHSKSPGGRDPRQTFAPKNQGRVTDSRYDSLGKVLGMLSGATPISSQGFQEAIPDQKQSLLLPA